MAQFLSSLDIKLPLVPSVTDSNDPALYPELLKLYSAIHAIHKEISKSTRAVCVFDEVAEEGQLVNIFTVAGILRARLASAVDNTKPAVGFCGAGGAQFGEAKEVLFLSYNKFLSSLVAGTLYYLSLTSGELTSTAPVTAGNIVQPVGYAVSDTELIFNPSNTWTQL